MSVVIGLQTTGEAGLLNELNKRQANHDSNVDFVSAPQITLRRIAHKVGMSTVTYKLQ